MMAPSGHAVDGLWMKEIVETPWIVALILVVAAVTLLLVVFLCACGKDDDKTTREKKADLEQAKGSPLNKGEQGSPSAKKEGYTSPKKVEPEKNALSDTQVGLPPPPMQPMMHDTTRMSTKVSVVAGSNPAYQTLLSNSKFEATQAVGGKSPETKANGGKIPEGKSVVSQSQLMQTAIATSQVKTTK